MYFGLDRLNKPIFGNNLVQSSPKFIFYVIYNFKAFPESLTQIKSNLPSRKEIFLAAVTRHAKVAKVVRHTITLFPWFFWISLTKLIFWSKLDPVSSKLKLFDVICNLKVFFPSFNQNINQLLIELLFLCQMNGSIET